MKISRTHTIFEIILVLLGVLLSLIFLYMSMPYWLSDTGWYIKLTFSFFVASFIFSAIGMILEFRSRIGGIFLLAVFLPFVYVFYVSGFLRIDGFVFGMLEGGCLSFYSYYNNRFDRLAMYLRRFIRIFVVFTSLYLILALIKIMWSSQEVPQFVLSGSNELFEFMILIGTLFAFSFLLTKTIRGIKAYDVFVYGPSRSGKTLLLLAFYNQFVTVLGGQRKEIIVSEKNKESLKIENMLADMEKGELPRSNLRTDLAIYLLSGKKGVKPVGMTFVDYGGEHTKNFDPTQYGTIIEELNKRFNIDVPTLEQNMGNIDFIKNLRDNHKNEFAEAVEKVTFAHVYKRFESAGKIIFLVDGDHIVDYHTGGKTNLTKLFGHYSNIINIFGNEKSYAIVVTKTDMFKDLSKIMEDSKEARDIEHEIYDLFCEITTFKEIVNMAYQMPIYMYTVSVDATMKPLTMESENPEMQREYPKINPWRVGEIGKFSF